MDSSLDDGDPRANWGIAVTGLQPSMSKDATNTSVEKRPVMLQDTASLTNKENQSIAYPVSHASKASIA